MESALLIAAVVAGVTGAWSPCGFSMVETLAPQGYAGRLRTTIVASATFAAGAVAGGIATFGGLSLLGEALGTGAPAVAAAVALAAAVGEARGARIVPQVRRQVPESWRRVLPVPLAAGLYGVLLGLGFTTFILSFAVWALAGVSVALGDPALGLLIGLGFGAGRALPVVMLAPSGGGSAAAAMAERPRLLRGLRAADAVALAACAAVLWAAPASAAAELVAERATDPSADAGVLAFHQPGAGGVLVRGGAFEPAPGPRPAVGGGRVAWIAGGVVEVRGPADAASIPAPAADSVALSEAWVAWRARQGEADELWAAPLAPGAGPPRRLAAISAPGELGRPALAGDRLLFHVSGPRDGRIDEILLTTDRRRVLRREPRALLLNPSAQGERLLYVRSTFTRQQLRIGALRPRRHAWRRARSTAPSPPGGATRGHEPGASHHRHGHPKRLPPRPAAGVADTLWSTALAADAAYVDAPAPAGRRAGDGHAAARAALRWRVGGTRPGFWEEAR